YLRVAMTYLCIEILGESAFHKFLNQSGWSGKDYAFRFNRATGSHMRAYRRLDDYYAERVDLHKTAHIWSLVANVLPAESIDPEVFVGEPTAGEPVAVRGKKGRAAHGA